MKKKSNFYQMLFQFIFLPVDIKQTTGKRWTFTRFWEGKSTMAQWTSWQRRS